MTRYNWQQADWPNFQYDLSSLSDDLFAIAEKTGLVRGKLAHFNPALQTEALIDFTLEEAIKTSEIEGEHFNRLDVRSSIKNQLGLNAKPISVRDKRAPGLVEMMFDVRNTFAKPLTKEKLFQWHFMLFSTSPLIEIAHWRTHAEPMQIISGNYGRQKVHYEAPPSKQVPKEMTQFLRWFNRTAPGNSHEIKHAAVRAAIAHLYFESIHPFEDGNGRIGRAIAEKALSQGLGSPVSLSLSQAIEAEKKSYYAALHAASRNNEITTWIKYFIKTVLQAQIAAEKQITFILKKSIFFDEFENVLNERQLKVIRRMLQAGVKGFEGGMSAKKYMQIANTSKATATRDLQALHELKIFKQLGEGRSVRYELKIEQMNAKKFF